MYDKDNSKGEKEVERKYTIRGSHMSEKQSESVSCSVPSESLQPHRLQLPGSSVHGISQARNLEWVAIPSPGDLPNPGLKPRSPALQADFLPSEPQGWLRAYPSM